MVSRILSKIYKPEWSNFCFYYKSAEFYVTFYQGYFKYKRKQEDYRRKSRETINLKNNLI